MEFFNRRRIAIFLLVLGILLLIYGLWILFGLLWPKKPTAQQPTGPGQVQIVQRAQPHVPTTLALPTTVQGTSTALDIQNAKVPALSESIRRAESVVSRMGSGTSQDGFLGYDDVMMDGTYKFRDFLAKEKSKMRELHPATGPTYGVTTRTVSSSVIDGSATSSRIMVRVQAQKAEDAGDRAKPTSITYFEATVTFLKQANNSFLVDEMTFAPVN
jgi:hypothetical protein